jgi:hypothetical protein
VTSPAYVIGTPVYAGTAVTTTATFTTPPGGTPADPTTVTLKFKSNAGETEWVYGVDEEIVRSSTGVYYAELDTSNTSGDWTVQWVGTGACAAISVAIQPVVTPPL